MAVDRHEARDNALAILKLEGLEPDQDTLELMDRWARGDADSEDLRAREREILARYGAAPAADHR